jgi:S-DNA-T family DNA segregation ATPase FtsK/SpoIIIE
MFFRRKQKSRAERDEPRSPILVRESWWVLAVAAVGYLALVLATYHRADPGWSISVGGDHVRNKGGAFGAWLADLLLYLFGMSAWWIVFAGAFAFWAAYRRVASGREDALSHPLLSAVGFALLLFASASVEAVRLWKVAATLPFAPGGVIGEFFGTLASRALGFNGGTLVLLAILAVGWSLFTGMSWLGVMERMGQAFDRFVEWARQRAEARRQRRAAESPMSARDARDDDVEFDARPLEVGEFEERPEREERTPVLVVPPVLEVAKSVRAARERQRPLFQDLPDSPLPPLSLLEEPPESQESVSPDTIDFTSRLIERKLADFGVSVKVLAAYPGPVITRYEIEPATGVKGSQILNLAKDLARALSVMSIRVLETIPGKSCMGLELPNPKRQVVKLVEILSSATYQDTSSPVTLVLGKDIAGKPVVADLARMPHLLVAGTTGSGKSVAINAMILSLLYKAEPRQVRLLLIDPKMLELSAYEGVPHLLAPVVTDMKLAANALNWCVGEMERRYRLMSKLGVRNLAGYNHKLADARKAGEPLTNPFTLTPESPEPLEDLPTIVVVIDELADLMMVTGKKIEELIARIAQKARAAGIHLILATQRPSVDVITGLIKANVPSRIAFQVASKVDSRTILDHMGAEALLGQGDMLFQPPGTGHPQRVHGAFVSDGEVHAVVNHLRSMGAPQYIDAVLEGSGEAEEGDGVAIAGADAESDPMYDQAVQVVLTTRRPSISLVQRHLRIGYNRAARLIEQMEKSGMVSAMQTNGNREVLVPAAKA